MNNFWQWKGREVAWNIQTTNDDPKISTLLIHGFGACKEHWRHNQSELARVSNCYAIDLIGFGNSSQPISRLKDEAESEDSFCYDFESWSSQIVDFCKEVIQQPVILIGNSIGGVIALRASQILENSCHGVVLIGCAQRTMDDKRIKEQPQLMRLLRPWLKWLVRQRWLSKNLFQNAANTIVIKRVLKQAYPSGKNVDNELVNLLSEPSKRPGAEEAFRGFINLFDDYLAPELMKDINIPVDLICGESDPWEPINEAKRWSSEISCIRSLSIIKGVGHCPHDEAPEYINKLLLKIIQQAK